MALSEVYDAIEAFSLTAGGEAITVYKPGSLPPEVHTADLPARVIMPMHAPQEGSQMRVRTFGHNLETIWEIDDVLLLDPVGQGNSLASKSLDLVNYMNAYRTVVQSNITLDNEIWIQDVKLGKGRIEYPEDSGNWFHGVYAVLTITEQT